MPVVQRRLVRPAWDDTCSCIRVAVTVSKPRPNETMNWYRDRWTQTVKIAYEGGSDWNYDADCPLCDCGTIRRTNVQDHPVRTGSAAPPTLKPQ